RRGAVGGAAGAALDAACRRDARLRPAPLALAEGLARPVSVATRLAVAPNATRRRLLPGLDAHPRPRHRSVALRRGAALPPRSPPLRPRRTRGEGAPVRAAPAGHPHRRPAA